MTRGFRTGIFFFEVNVFIISYLLFLPAKPVARYVALTYVILALIECGLGCRSPGTPPETLTRFVWEIVPARP
ncbi:MAG: hypothetical protein U5N26_01635 [Candidatus Marinimicrobia bacterium]|nr:hypothetical protein [Candidatus Neomarinimicrobiota bacterium]